MSWGFGGHLSPIGEGVYPLESEGMEVGWMNSAPSGFFGRTTELLG